jgi:hypothetical protein
VWKLVRVSDEREIPAQRTGDSLVFLAKNEKAEYRIAARGASNFPKVECADDGKGLTISVGGKKVLRYNHAVIEQPDPVFSRSGYLHPVWTPSGKVITNDSPKNHLHHHGIWSAWTSSEFEGRKSNFWESKEKQGRIECVGVEEKVSGPVFGGFKARHRFIHLNGAARRSRSRRSGRSASTRLRPLRLRPRLHPDLRDDQPLVIKEYRYGGIGFRGSPTGKARPASSS